MLDRSEGPPIIPIPERIDRRMRLGPFPSSRDALKFMCYAAGAAVLATLTTAWVWAPFALLGFGVSVWKPDGYAVDERAWTFLHWKLRGTTRYGPVTPRMLRGLVRQGLLEVSPRRLVAMVRSGGTPIAYLPPDELARRFEAYRDLIRSLDGDFALFATVTPIRSQAIRPETPEEEGADSAARVGYTQLATLLCRRRLLRRVYFVIGTVNTGPDSIAHLESQVSVLLERLSVAGLEPSRLRDRSLVEAARHVGWKVEGPRT